MAAQINLGESSSSDDEADMDSDPAEQLQSTSISAERRHWLDVAKPFRSWVPNEIELGYYATAEEAAVTVARWRKARQQQQPQPQPPQQQRPPPPPPPPQPAPPPPPPQQQQQPQQQPQPSSPAPVSRPAGINIAEQCTKALKAL
eukprot:6248082-Prymnesium_polylepis.1